MISLFTAKSHSGTFRLRWRGYDREQVDEFLRQTAADRHRLEESLAQLETFMAAQSDERRREFERLAKLRVDVASCLETSIGALRTATQLLSREQGAGAVQTLHGEHIEERSLRPRHPLRPSLLVRFQWRRPAWLSNRRLQALAASAFLMVFVPAAFYYRSSAREITAETPAMPLVALKQHVEEPNQPPPPIIIAHQAEGLVLTLTAKRQCWIRTRIDGGQPLERLLKADETIMLRANDEAFLRVGDASALSMLINNRQAKPLGASGQVVSTRITRASYQSLLVED